MDNKALVSVPAYSFGIFFNVFDLIKEKKNTLILSVYIDKQILKIFKTIRMYVHRQENFLSA